MITRHLQILTLEILQAILLVLLVRSTNTSISSFYEHRQLFCLSNTKNTIGQTLSSHTPDVFLVETFKVIIFFHQACTTGNYA